MRLEKEPACDYDIVIDIDGVLLDIHSQMSVMLAEQGLHYDVNEQHVYEIDKFINNTSFNHDPRLKPAIYKLFENPDLYTQSASDWHSIYLIRQYADTGIKFMIYTLSSNSLTMAAKCKLFNTWFPEKTPNIVFRSSLAGENAAKPVINNIKAVIEDSHINLSHYDKNILKYLVNKPYNQYEFNQEYKAVFKDDKFKRCPNTFCAIKSAVEQIDT